MGWYLGQYIDRCIIIAAKIACRGPMLNKMEWIYKVRSHASLEIALDKMKERIALFFFFFINLKTAGLSVPDCFCGFLGLDRYSGVDQYKSQKSQISNCSELTFLFCITYMAYLGHP